MNQDKELYTLQFLLPPSQETLLRDWIQRHRYATWPNWGGHITLVNIFEPWIDIEEIAALFDNICRQTAPFKIYFNRVVMEHHRVHQGLYTVYLTHPTPCIHECNELKRFHEEIIALLGPAVEFQQKELETKRYRQHLSLTWGVPKEQARELYEQARDWRLELWCILDSITLLKVLPKGKKRWEMKIFREFGLNTQKKS